MKITAAAIKFVINGEEKVIKGRRHADIYWLIHEMYPSYRRFEHQNEITEGFLVDDNDFVDRYEAANIAYQYGQINNPVAQLYSEDVW